MSYWESYADERDYEPSAEDLLLDHLVDSCARPLTPRSFASSWRELWDLDPDSAIHALVDASDESLGWLTHSDVMPLLTDEASDVRELGIRIATKVGKHAPESTSRSVEVVDPKGDDLPW